MVVTTVIIHSRDKIKRTWMNISGMAYKNNHNEKMRNFHTKETSFTVLQESKNLICQPWPDKMSWRKEQKQ